MLRLTRLLAISALFAATLQAQTHRVAAPEDVIRSVGVYEWTGELAKPDAARLVPVSLFVNGELKDGGTYYARPIPLALVNGNIYSLEKAGVAQGTVTLDFARHLQPAAGGAEDSTNLGWFGYGTFATLPAPKKTAALHASATPAAIVSSKDDDRPTFVMRNRDNTKVADTSGTGNKTSQTSSTPPADDDPDRPHLSKAPAPTSSTPPQSTTSSAPASAPSSTPAGKASKEDTSPVITVEQPDDDKDRPTLRHRDPKQAEADRKARDRSGVVAVGSLNDDPDRPNMRRGRTAGIGGAPAPQLSGMPTGLHQIVAVSDPTTREPHPFAREWATPTERADILGKMEATAREKVLEYARSNGTEQPQQPVPHVAPRMPSGARHTGSTRGPSAGDPAPQLSNAELTGYTLSYGGLPTFVYAAISPGFARHAASMTAAISPPETYVTVVAQELPSGELQVALTSVTDSAHLDRTPWFRLIDAVDPDAGHRASLLFELRAHSGRQFALYRILSAKAEQIFVTTPTD